MILGYFYPKSFFFLIIKIFFFLGDLTNILAKTSHMNELHETNERLAAQEQLAEAVAQVNTAVSSDNHQ